MIIMQIFSKIVKTLGLIVLGSSLAHSATQCQITSPLPIPVSLTGCTYSGFINASGYPLLSSATVVAGTNVTITQSASSITINSSGGSGSPGGSSGQAQYNSAGSFAGSTQTVVTSSSWTFNSPIKATSMTDSGLTATQMCFAGTGGLLSGSSNLVWTNSINQLRINGDSSADFPLLVNARDDGGFTNGVNFNSPDNTEMLTLFSSQNGSNALTLAIPGTAGDIIYGTNATGSDAIFSGSGNVYFASPIKMSGSNTITASSNTILSGATFYQNGPELLSGPAVVGNQTSATPSVSSMFDVRLTSNTYTDPFGGKTWAARIIDGASSPPTGGLEIIADQTSSVNSLAFAVGDPSGNKFFAIDAAGDFSITSNGFIVATGGSYGLPAFIEYKNASGFGSATAEVRTLGTASQFSFGIDGNGSDNNAFINQVNNAPINILTNNTQAVQIAGSGAVTVSSNTILPGTTFYQNGTAIINGVNSSAWLTGNQTITVTGDSTGSGTTSIALTAAGLQKNITTFTSSITISGTAASDNTPLVSISSANATVLLQVNNNGHLISSGTVPSAPTSCGVSPSMDNSSTDFAGIINVGSGVVTSCTLNMASSFINSPICVCSDDSSTVGCSVTSRSTTAEIFSLTATLGSGHIFYVCVGAKG